MLVMIATNHVFINFNWGVYYEPIKDIFFVEDIVTSFHDKNIYRVAPKNTRNSRFF